MPRVGVSITKSTSFRGVAEEFSNTYYYNVGLIVTAAVADNLIDAVAGLEKPMFASNVTFVRGKVWSTGGTKAENQMLAQKNLSGTGTNAASASTAMDKERAFLVRARAGVDTKGRPVYLRKWWHLGIGTVNGVAVDNNMLQNTSQLTSAQRTQLQNWFDSFKLLTNLAQNFTLVAESGREITGDTVAHPYLEHHQLGDQWRG